VEGSCEREVGAEKRVEDEDENREMPESLLRFLRLESSIWLFPRSHVCFLVSNPFEGFSALDLRDCFRRLQLQFKQESEKSDGERRRSRTA
jgi:hypothetical protein